MSIDKKPVTANVTKILAARQRYASINTESVVKGCCGWQVYCTLKECIDAFNDITEVHFGYERDLQRMITALQSN